MSGRSIRGLCENFVAMLCEMVAAPYGYVGTSWILDGVPSGIVDLFRHSLTRR